jgi:hypothetical protein
MQWNPTAQTFFNSEIRTGTNACAALILAQDLCPERAARHAGERQDHEHLEQ